MTRTRAWTFALATMLVPLAVPAADPPARPNTAPPARSKVDPAKAAAHAKEDIRRHRVMAAAHEAAAKCLESGRDEDACTAELAAACKGIAIGKHCGMRHAD